MTKPQQQFLILIGVIITFVLLLVSSNTFLPIISLFITFFVLVIIPIDKKDRL